MMNFFKKKRPVETIKPLYQPKLKYSDQAKVLLNNLNLDNIDLEEMEDWISKNCFVVGDAWINHYLFYKSNK